MPRSRILRVPSPSLVVMVGAAASGKSTFCRRHFSRSAIVSTDACRARLSGDAADQSASGAAFALAHRLADRRLERGLRAVFDATSTGGRARRALLAIARRRLVPAVAIVLDSDASDCV